jgi:putative SOS response-associated peptidase YedK
MCGRYSVLTEDEIIEIRQIIKEWSVRIVKDDFENYEQPFGEVRPTDSAPVIVCEEDGISFENLRWGFKKWDGKGVIINARSETLKTKSLFSRCLDMGRCVVPAGEYFEWEKLPQGKRKYYIKDGEGHILFMAGLYRNTAEGREFVIITKDAFGDVVNIHDRMPVILRANQVEDWLNGKLSPDDITDMDFNVSVNPCEGEDDGQLSLDLS